MPPRLYLRVGRQATRHIVQRFYSSNAAADPLVRVTNLPATNTGHIRVLELNRPAARNAISKSLLAELRAEVDNVQAQYTSDGEELPPAF